MNEPPSADSAAMEFSIGVDTGGTYTDAIALDARRQVVASAKSLTTQWDLSIGLDGAIRAVLAKLPDGARREHVSLVSVSTTLATNAVVENRFSPICTILIGFDERMVERSGLRRGGGGAIVQVGGGHEATGEAVGPWMRRRSRPPCASTARRWRPSRSPRCSRCAIPRTSGARASSSVPAVASR